MGIYGGLEILEPKKMIRDIEIGEIYFLHKNNILVSFKKVCIELYSEVLTEEELLEKISHYPEHVFFSHYAQVKRIKEGAESECFEIILPEISSVEPFFLFERYYNFYLDMLSKSGEFIIFEDFELVFASLKNEYVVQQEETLTLEDQLKIALEVQDFKKAAEIRDEIGKREKDEE